MNFKTLASSLLTKFILGMILAATIVIAIVYFLQLLHVYLTEFNNGVAIETTVYALMLAGSIVGIYFLLAEPSTKKNQSHPPSLPLPVDVETLGLKFLEGFMDGMGKKLNSHPTS